MATENVSVTEEREPLTPRQKDAYDFICRTAGMWGPAVREIAAGIGVSSPNAVAGLLKRLERKGYITIEPGQTRGIRVRT